MTSRYLVLLVCAAIGTIGCERTEIALHLSNPDWDSHYKQTRRDLATEMQLIRTNHGLNLGVSKIGPDMEWLNTHDNPGTPLWEDQFSKRMDLLGCEATEISEILSDGPLAAGQEPTAEVDSCIANGRTK